MADTASPTAAEERNFGRRVLLSVTLGFLAIIGAGIAAGYAVQRSAEHTNWLVHTYDVERAIADIDDAVREMRFTRRGYLINQRPDIREDYAEAQSRLQSAIGRVAELTRDNPAQQSRVVALPGLAREFDVRLRRTLDQADEGIITGVGYSDGGSAEYARRLHRVTTAMLGTENQLLETRRTSQQQAILLFYSALSVGAVLVLVVAIASVTTIRRYTQNLAQSRDQLQLLNDNLEQLVRSRTVDLQRANEEIQRFAYIVSHDLRSPLVNVMGFTSELEASTKPLRALIDRVEQEAPELTNEDAKLAARQDLPEAIGFIRTSTQKMDRLINAILRLSREGRRTITPEQLDMTALFQGVADTLKHQTDEVGAQISVASDLPWLNSDRLAIEQIAANLVENAVKYLDPARPGQISITGGRRGDRILFQVKDNGRGIDPKDHHRVFDLFRRSGTQDQPGEGIGLAHSRAMAYRLGGTIQLESALGQGAMFEINLPAKFADAGEKNQ